MTGRRMVEEPDQDLGVPLPPTQIAAQFSAKLTHRSGTPPARRVGLDVMVQQLHGMRLGAVAGQNVQLDLVGVASNPGADQPGPVHRMAVHDQVDLPPAAIA